MHADTPSNIPVTEVYASIFSFMLKNSHEMLGLSSQYDHFIVIFLF